MRRIVVGLLAPLLNLSGFFPAQGALNGLVGQNSRLAHTGPIRGSSYFPVIVLLLPPYRNHQTSLFEALGMTGAVEGAWVEVELLSGGPVMPYLSVVDNRTGDAVYIAAIS